MLKQVKRFIEAEEGATAVEYGIIVAAIAALIITAVVAVGGKIQTAFEDLNTKLVLPTP